MQDLLEEIFQTNSTLDTQEYEFISSFTEIPNVEEPEPEVILQGKATKILSFLLVS